MFLTEVSRKARRALFGGIHFGRCQSTATMFLTEVSRTKSTSSQKYEKSMDLGKFCEIHRLFEGKSRSKESPKLNGRWIWLTIVKSIDFFREKRSQEALLKLISRWIWVFNEETIDF